jgi:pimeloyl-ACP methyl ester carboxylesterase
MLVLLGIGYLVGSFWIDRAETETAKLPPGVPGRLIDVGANPVHVVEHGSGPPLLLVHGFAGSTYDWEEHVLEPLSRDHRVIALDLWGMGFSGRDNELAYGLDVWADQLRGTLDALGIERAAVAGHSMGGAVAAAFAAAYPERVERLVLVAPLVPLEENERSLFFRVITVPGAGEAILGWLDHLPSLPGFSNEYHERARAAFRIHGTRRALLRWVRSGYDREQLASVYRRITVPTLIIAGRSDDVVPWVATERTATTIDGALVLPLDGVGHWVLRDAPDQVVATIEAAPRGG